MNIPPVDELEKIWIKSILAPAKEHKNKILKSGVGPGRYTGGPHLEDIAYLVTKFLNLDKNKKLVEGERVPLEDWQSLALQQMVGIPARRINAYLNNDEVGKRLTEVFNKTQDSWYFDFEPHTSSGTSSPVMRYLVRNVELMGGNELGLGGLLDL